jgi:OmpA-OmpF porin, OOP family
MKRLFFFFLFCYWFLLGNAQNLVRNPGMDSSVTCPNGLGDIINCQYWFNPTGNSPDYFHLCRSGLAPTNAIGWQMPYSDSAYLGFGTYVNINPNSREYVEGILITPLLTGKKYCVEIYLSLANNCEAATAPVGIYFSDTLINIPLDSVFGAYLHNLPFTPQIEFPLVSDSANWVLVSDTFIANGGEQYFTIGNFRNSASIVVDTLYPFIVGFDSYYYLDNVSVYLCEDTAQPPPPVEPVSSISIPNIFTPNGDNINDDFRIETENLTAYSLDIYNRWGVQVFTTASISQFWDGRTTSGIECSDGTYYYIISAMGADNKPYSLKGFVTLLR